LPPAAAPLEWKDIWHGVAGLTTADRSIRRLEDELRREFGIRHVFLLSSGTAALALTLLGLRSLSARRAVVLPAFTCFSVPAAVLTAGLVPAPCDIDASTFDFDRAGLERGLTDDTLCVIAHHLFGVPSDIERIRALCRERGILIVEDAAQAMGAEVGGCKLGTKGDVGIFSLGRGKNITCGAGGIIVTNTDAIAEAIGRYYQLLAPATILEQARESLRVFLMTIFIRPALYWIPAALPWLKLGQTVFPTQIELKRLGAFHAGLLGDWRRRLERANEGRAETAKYFQRHVFRAHPSTDAVPYLRFPVAVAYPADRCRIHSESRRRGLGISTAYPTAVDEIPEVRSVCGAQPFPAARRAAEQLLTLPTHHWLSDKDKHAIVNLLRDVDLAMNTEGGDAGAGRAASRDSHAA